MTTIDLHLHSNHSRDGNYSPTELVNLCSKLGLKLISLADHNTVSGVVEAQRASWNTSLSVIPAVELDCYIEEVNLHVLGYGIDIHHPGFLDNEMDILQQEQTASRERIELIKKLGIHLDDQVVFGMTRTGIVTGEMIAEAAMNDRSNKGNPLLQPYLPGGEKSNSPYVHFYWDFCAQEKPAYVKINYLSLADTIRLTIESGGIPVFAHPGNNIKENRMLLDKIIACGVKGIEAFSSYHNSGQITFYLEYALKHNLLITCGSDFHGKTKPTIQPGSVPCDGYEDQIMNSMQMYLA